jgi:transcriptional regulator with XRE-family HTH domain
MSELIQHLLTSLSSEQDPVKQAEYIVQLRRQGIANLEIAKLLGKTPSQISHIARINKLPDIVLDAYYSKMLSVTHLYILSRLRFEAPMRQVFEKVMAGGLSTQETDRLVREKLHDVTDAGEYVDSDLVATHIATLQLRGVGVHVIQTRTRLKYTVEVRGNVVLTSRALEEVMRVMQTYEPFENEVAEDMSGLPEDTD